MYQLCSISYIYCSIREMTFQPSVFFRRKIAPEKMVQTTLDTKNKTMWGTRDRQLDIGEHNFKNYNLWHL